RSIQRAVVQVSPDTVVVSLAVLLPSLDSVKAFAGSIVAVKVRGSSDAPRFTMKFTVRFVLPPPGRLPVQSTVFDTGAPQVKPLEPAAPRNVTPAAGRPSETWTPLAVSVPPLEAITV